MRKNKNTTKNTSVATVNNTATKNQGSEDKKTTYYGKYSYQKNYNYKGIKNITSYPEFINLCKPTQKELKLSLVEELIVRGYTEVISDDGYVYAKGTVPVLLTAHMDTVHKETMKDFYEYYDEEKEQHIISSPQGIGGDDRCGIYMILEIIKTHKCSVLFCEDEETGGIGSRKFCKTEFINDLSELKYLIELDRKNSKDAVFYDCDNDDFTKFIEDNTGYKDAYGSFSDISNLSPACKVASVNFSCGYYNAHTISEYVVMEEMLNTIEVVKKLLDVECDKFEYVEKVRYNYGYGRNRSGYGYGYGYDYFDEDIYDKYYDRNYYRNNNYYASRYVKPKEEEEKSLYIYVYSDETKDMYTYISNGKTEDEAFGKFFKENPEFCYNDVYDYEWYSVKVCDSGWYKNKF